MRCILFASLACLCGAALAPLKLMAKHAAWGAANDKKYGKEAGEWDAHEARHASHLDALNEALEEAPVVKYVDLMATSAAWGAANERAYGKSRSGAQVDWDMFFEHEAKVKSLVGNDQFVTELASAAKAAAWYAANKYWYGEGNDHTRRDLQDFQNAIKDATKLAPPKWPMKEVQEVFKFAALAASAHRITDVEKRKRQSKDHQFHLIYEDSAVREDWKNYHDAAVDLKKELGSEQYELFEQFEGMVIESAWGAACERTHGKHSNDAKVHWRKYQAHEAEAKASYKGAVNWIDIKQMIEAAAWGAANERAFGQSNADAQRSWREFESAASRVSGAHGGGEL